MRLTPYHALLVAISLILGAATPFLWERLNRAPKIKENTVAEIDGSGSITETENPFFEPKIHAINA